MTCLKRIFLSGLLCALAVVPFTVGTATASEPVASSVQTGELAHRGWGGGGHWGGGGRWGGGYGGWGGYSGYNRGYSNYGYSPYYYNSYYPYNYYSPYYYSYYGY